MDKIEKILTVMDDNINNRIKEFQQEEAQSINKMVKEIITHHKPLSREKNNGIIRE